MRISTLLVALAAAGSSTLALAQNAVPNPDMDTDVNGWSSSGANTTISFDGTRNIVGMAGSGSLKVLSTGQAGAVSQASQCVVISQTGPSNFGAWLLLPTEGAGIGARVSILLHSNPTCSAAIPGSFMATDGPSSGQPWKLYTSTIDVPTNAMSVQLSLQISIPQGSPPVLAAYFDGVRFGPAPTSPVELQSFEVD